MKLALLLVAIAIVGLGGVIVVAIWWSMADKWFPDVSRKTGQRSPLSLLKSSSESAPKGPPPVVVRIEPAEPQTDTPSERAS